MPASFPPPVRPNSRLAAAYALFGFGGSLCLPALFAIQFFIGRRGPPLIAYRPNHPLLLVVGGMFAVGVVLLILGRYFLNTAETKVRDFGGGRAGW